MGLLDFFKKKGSESNKVKLEIIDLPHIGQVDLNKLKDYYKSKININNNKISIDINFENKTIAFNKIENIKNFILNIDKFDILNKTFIQSDFNNIGETSDYINFYFDELKQVELSDIINLDRTDIPKEVQLLNKLRLVRVGLYPDRKYGFGVFDYSIDVEGEPCNQLLVINTNEKGNVNNITW